MDIDQVVVIGSGPCGAIAVRRLVERGIRTVLLESGTAVPRGLFLRVAGHPVLRYANSEPVLSDSGFMSAGDANTVWYRVLRPRGRSNYWTGAVPRFEPADFGDGSVDEVHRWPLSYADLEPYYDAIEGMMQLTGDPSPSTSYLRRNAISWPSLLPDDWAQLVEPARSMGHDLLPMPMANGAPWSFLTRGTEFNSWHALVAPLLHNPQLTVMTGSHACRLLWDATEGRVSAVEYIDQHTGETRLLPARHVVVAAGALNSTRLLLSSTSDDHPDGLGNDHGVLGRYLHDHPKDWWELETDRPLTLPGHPVHVSRHHPASGGHPLRAAAWTVGLATRSDRIKTLRGGTGNLFGVQAFGTMVPSPEHGVALAPGSSDEFGQPELQIDIHFDKPTRETMTSARFRLQEVFAAAGVEARAVGGCEASLPGPGSSVHYAGTVRMHSRPQLGVVDDRCRLHSVPNVQVVDTSVFTTGPEKNPVLTAMAIAARAMQCVEGD